MTNFRENLRARKIVLTEDDIGMVVGIANRRLHQLELYQNLPEDIQSIILNNVAIVAATDNIKRCNPVDKVNIIIANLGDAIDLVISDAQKASATLG